MGRGGMGPGESGGGKRVGRSLGLVRMRGGMAAGSEGEVDVGAAGAGLRLGLWKAGCNALNSSAGLRLALTCGVLGGAGATHQRHRAGDDSTNSRYSLEFGVAIRNGCDEY